MRSSVLSTGIEALSDAREAEVKRGMEVDVDALLVSELEDREIYGDVEGGVDVYVCVVEIWRYGDRGRDSFEDVVLSELWGR